VCADVDGDGVGGAEFGEELATVWGDGVVELVVTEPGGDGFVVADGFGEIDVDRDRLLGREGGSDKKLGEDQRARERQSEGHGRP